MITQILILVFKFNNSLCSICLHIVILGNQCLSCNYHKDGSIPPDGGYLQVGGILGAPLKAGEFPITKIPKQV